MRGAKKGEKGKKEKDTKERKSEGRERKWEGKRREMEKRRAPKHQKILTFLATSTPLTDGHTHRHTLMQTL